MVNLTLGEMDTKGNPVDHFYEDAREKWTSWREQNVIIQMGEPAVWRLRETYSSPTHQSLSRTGFIALIGVEDYSVTGVQPHERTHAGPKEDRHKLLRHTGANLSPILFVYQDDPQRTHLTQQTYQADDVSHATLDHNGSVEIEFSCTTDEEWISHFCSDLGRSIFLIADGHHRYEAALAFHRDRDEDPGLRTSHVMGYFVPSSSEGLVIHPTHRGIFGLAKEDKEKFTNNLNEYFDMDMPGNADPSIPSLRYVSDRNEQMKIQIKREIYHNLKKNLMPPALASLQVTVFEEIILKEILRLSRQEIAHHRNLLYFHTEDECSSAVKSGKIDFAFLLDPIDTDTLFLITAQGSVLPQKSTYFYPKCPVGIVIHSLENL